MLGVGKGIPIGEEASHDRADQRRHERPELEHGVLFPERLTKLPEHLDDRLRATMDARTSWSVAVYELSERWLPWDRDLRYCPIYP